MMTYIQFEYKRLKKRDFLTSGHTVLLFKTSDLIVISGPSDCSVYDHL